MNTPVDQCPDCGMHVHPPWTRQDRCGSTKYCGLRQYYHEMQAEFGWPITEYHVGRGYRVRSDMKADRLAIEAEQRRRGQRR